MPIRIERTPIQTFYLGYFGFDHLQLVYEPISTTSVALPQDEWFIMEGVRLPTTGGVILSVLGANGNLPLRLAAGGLTGDALVSEIGTPESRGSRLIVTSNEDAVWRALSFHAQDILDTAYAYNGYGSSSSVNPTLNSTSFIASVLYFAGLDITANLPNRLRFSPGYQTLLGGYENDDLTIDANFNAIFGGFGEDTLHGIDDQNRIDRLYGGGDNDTLSWSPGVDFLHGGDRSLDYASDGIDTVDFSGAGEVFIEAFPFATDHRTPQYVARYDTGIAWLFSIERLTWTSNSSDHITTGEGVELILEPLTLSFGGDSGDPRGDQLDFANHTDGLLFNGSTDTAHFIQALSGNGQGGWWVDSVEWLIGTQGNDRFYTNAELRGIEAGPGNDFVDVRDSTPFAGTSPLGYDIEVYGGDGNDIIVSGHGRTYAEGGEGADIFVLSSLTSGNDTTELVIVNADASDHLYVPYNLFNGSGLDLDGSQLMPLLGGIGTFEELQQGWTSYYEHQTWEQITFGNDQSQGVIEFIGYIEYTLEGSDLLIHLYTAELLTETYVIDDVGNTETFRSFVGTDDGETVIRVVDFQEGDLGLQFLDPGDATTLSIDGQFYTYYPDLNDAVDSINGPFLSPLDERPTAPSSDPNDPASQSPTPHTPTLGTSGPDLISLDQPSNVQAGDGDDTITSTGNHDDRLDGGEGADTLEGGGGNDTYVVDNTGDVVIESIAAGTDSVIASINYVLPENVEDLTLTGAALTGTGNTASNRLSGNLEANTLIGLEGNDSLSGDLGNDILIGGDGSDGYIYFQGDGNDVIIDEGTGENDIDSLVLFGDIRPEDVTAVRLDSAPDDLVLVLIGGGRITIAGYFADPSAGIERVYFETGHIWDRDAIDSLAASASTVDALAPEATNDLDLIYGGSDYIVPAALLLANDIANAEGTLSIVSVANPSTGTAYVNANGDIQLQLPNGYEGPLSFTYSVTDGIGGIGSAHVSLTIVPNTAPEATAALDDQSVTAGTPWSYTLPDDLFIDADDDLISVDITRADGSALPSWLSYDWATRTLSGTPPTDAPEAIGIRVRAYDGFATTDLTFAVDIVDRSVSGETIAGTSGDDTFSVVGNDGGLDAYFGGEGYDVIQGSDYNDTIGISHLSSIEAINGGLGYDTIRLTAGNDLLDLSGIAVSGIELIDAGSGDDTIVGSSGADTIRGGAGNDIIDGGAGDDTLTVVGGAEGYDTFIGGDGFDVILGSAFNDVIALANTADNLAGIEAIDGGDGNDTIRLTAANDVLDLSGIAVSGIELIDAGSGDDTIVGSSGADTIRGGAGNDIIDGGAGDDTLTVVGGAEGYDTFIGGDGFDVILGSAFNDVIALANTADNLAGIEAIDGGDGNDTIRLTAGNDLLDLSGIAVSGIELIDAGGGNDQIISSAGDDIIQGGAGADNFVVGTGGHDWILDFSQSSGDVIDLSAAGFVDFADLLEHAATSGENILISIDAARSLTVAHLQIAALSADQFVL